MSLFRVRGELSSRTTVLLTIASFICPLLLWCAISYVPWLWHPQMKVSAVGDSTFQIGMRVNRVPFADENKRLLAAGQAPAVATPANPVFLPAPHEVARALYTAFTTPPRRGDKWLHENLLHSFKIIFGGFAFAVVFGVPLGILCGVFAAASRMTEPFVDFIRYMPPPTFGALALAVLGIADEPKMAIIVIGIFFNLVLVVANTTRQVDRALLEAALTLGAKPRQLVIGVVIPAVLPNLYNDLRIFLGVGWCYLTIAEMVGASSGISLFINQQGKYRNYDNVFAGIIIIGVIGLLTDQILAFIGRHLFPWRNQPTGAFGRGLWSGIWFLPALVTRSVTSVRRRPSSLPAAQEKPSASDSAI